MIIYKGSSIVVPERTHHEQAGAELGRQRVVQRRHLRRSPPLGEEPGAQDPQRHRCDRHRQAERELQEEVAVACGTTSPLSQCNYARQRGGTSILTKLKIPLTGVFLIA